MANTQPSLLGADKEISRLQNLLLTVPRLHPLHSKFLSGLAIVRLTRYMFSHESEDLDISISQATEAILRSFNTLGSYLIEVLFYLSRALIHRSQDLKRPRDVKHAIIYLRYLQDQSLETSKVTRNKIKVYLVCALAVQVEQESVDPMQGIGEMATLCRELLTLGDLDPELLISSVNRLVNAILMTIRPIRQPPPDGAIECLREARIRLPDLKQVRLPLALSLRERFNQAHSHDDYEEAMSIADEIIAEPYEGMEAGIHLAGELALIQWYLDPKPEHLAEVIFRIRAYLNAIPSDDPGRGVTIELLACLEKVRFEAFGVRSGRQEDNAEVVDDWHLAVSQMAKSYLVEFPLPMPDERSRGPHLRAIVSILGITDPTNMEKAIEYCRLCITSPHSHLPATFMALGKLLHRLFHLTGNIKYLQESITVNRDFVKMPGVQGMLYAVVSLLIDCLFSRFWLFKGRRDIDEIMELYPVAATDTSIDVSHRILASYAWTQTARYTRHPSTLNAYETTISLMQESLSFAPTLEIQHFRLVAMRGEYEKLPLNYASYLIQTCQLKGAIETLEQGRGLLWSEMRGLRTSVDHLRVVNLPLAEAFAALNRDLEALTISGFPAVWMGDGQVVGHEAMDPLGHLVVKQRKLVEERDRLISQIRAQPGFHSFLVPPSFDTLRSAAAGGPVISINHSEWRSDIIILLHDSPPSLIPTSGNFYDRAKGLHAKLLAARNSGLDSREYEDALGHVLEHLYDLVGRPVIQRLRELKVPEQSRVWWCPTSVFCSLPLHAMGPIRSDGPIKLYFSDLYIPSYTPTLSALIESRKPSTQPLNTPSILLVVQPDAQMPSSLQEMRVVRTVCPLVETLSQKKATPISTLERLKYHRFAHISCHGVLEIGKPFDAFFMLHKDTRLTLLDIVRSRLPTAEFAFLSACHTAEITEESIANEGLHLAAAVQYSGFRSVVGTMWAMVDIDGPVVAESFYQSVFLDKWQGVPYYERTAEALRNAVRNLRGKRKMPLERWVNYVHYGA